MLYVGGGCLDAAPELRAFVERTGIPVAQTLMGLGTHQSYILWLICFCFRLEIHYRGVP